MDQALNSQKTPHTSPLRASYGMSFVSILMKNDRVIKGFYCTQYEIMQSFRNCFMLIDIALNVWQPRVYRRIRDRIRYTMLSAKQLWKG